MRSQFLQYAVLLFVTLLFSASGSLLRGDQAIRSPRLVEKKNESSQSDKAGKKSNSSADSKKSKRKKEETKGDNPPTSSAMSEKGVQQIVHSHHPKAATVDEGTDEKYGKKSKGQRKDSMKQQEKGEFSVPDDEHDEQGAVKFDNGNTDIHEQVLSRASRTQHQSLYDENEGMC